MIFIGGISNKIRELGPGELKSCKNCSKEKYHVIKESCDRLSLFFIPIVPFNKKLFSICPDCSYTENIDAKNSNYYRDLVRLNQMFLNNLIEEKEYFLRKQTLKKPQP